VTIAASQGTVTQSGSGTELVAVGPRRRQLHGNDHGDQRRRVDGQHSFTFTVTDVAPSVAVTSASTSIAETGTAVASGIFADYDDA